MTMDEFLALANGRCKLRRFDAEDFTLFEKHVAAATGALQDNSPYYWEHNAGGVANSYGYQTTTATCGVWVDVKTETVEWFVGRMPVRTRNVPCVLHGGKRSYYKRAREAMAHMKEVA